MKKTKNIEQNEIICEFDSSNIKKSVYDTKEKTLDVYFHNDRKYRYYDIEHDEYVDFERANSQGKFLNKTIKPKYNYKRLI